MGVAVPWASIYFISEGLISDFIFSKHLSIASSWPSGFGAAMAFPLPSELAPIPLMTARMESSSLIASFILFSTKTAVPSPRINPLAFSSKGNDPFAESAPIFEKPMNDSGTRWVLTPPAITWSYSPDKSSLQAASTAVNEEAQAASTI